MLFNPDTRSANFFIPGLLVVMCQLMATQFAANTIVREKVNGTLEQLFMTPVQARELILGKLTPYLILTILEMCGITLLMVVIFRVPIHGTFLTLMAISIPFILTTLGLGLFISTKANSTDEAGQLVMGTVMPSIFLSGYVFPVDSMPWIFQQIAMVVPTTWLIDASRGVILRGAGWRNLWPHATVLWGMAAAVLTVSGAAVPQEGGMTSLCRKRLRDGQERNSPQGQDELRRTDCRRLEGNVAALLAGQPPGSRQPEASTSTRGTTREKRVEQMFDVASLGSRAGILNRDPQPISGHHFNAHPCPTNGCAFTRDAGRLDGIANETG